MKYYKLLLVFICFLSISLQGAVIPKHVALQNAKEFYQMKFTTRSGNEDVRFKEVVIKSILEEDGTKDPLFYIFNLENSQGFVIASGDDALVPVLGYSTSSSIDVDNLPPNFFNWITLYKDELNSENNGFVYMPEKKQASQMKECAPLLGEIKWGQDAPYNDLCPSVKGRKVVTGCVATAMAQIMKYYSYPERGLGMKYYVTPSINMALSSVFSEHQYDWDNMLPTYDQNSPQVAKDAVSLLMSDCGISIEMDYNIGENGGSGAYNEFVPISLTKYFGYDSNMQNYHREYVPYNEWEKLIRDELDAGRPVLYGGQSSRGGHSFVCDGYDQQGLFHFNWGWDGVADGYFVLTALNPLNTSADNGYNRSHVISVGIQKPSSESTPRSIFIFRNNLTCQQTETSRTNLLIVKPGMVYNFGAYPFSGELGLGLFQNGELVHQLGASIPQESIALLYGVDIPSFRVAIPLEIPNGKYQVYAMSKATGEKQWSKIYAAANYISYLDVTLTSDLIKIESRQIDAGLVASPFNEDDILVEVYPNPTSDRINISANHTLSYIKVYGIGGNVVYDNSNMQRSSMTIDVSSWSKGIYILEGGNDHEKFMKKVIVK
ncbi:MAG: thiol protease/hemagglutinin PrtT [Bacteroidales bacterium]